LFKNSDIDFDGLEAWIEPSAAVSPE